MVDVVSRIKLLFTTKGAEKATKETEKIGRAQTRLGQASASSGRQFSAQASGLGGLVSVYAGAAANIFALTMAFGALQRAAQAEQIVKGTRTLAREIGMSGDSIIAKVQEITDGQLSLVDTATQLNAALSAGFGEEQILRLTDVSMKASRALGRDLADSFNRLVRGAAKLEPELIDELGIFTRIEPAVQKYAAANNVAASSLTNFERRQAFLNEVIDEGERKFANIDTSSENSQKSFEQLLASIKDLATELGGFVANVLTPVVNFFNKAGNQIVLFGGIAMLVMGKLRQVMGTAVVSGVMTLSTSLEKMFVSMKVDTQTAIADFQRLGAQAKKTLAGTRVIQGGGRRGVAQGKEIRGLLDRGEDISMLEAARGSKITQQRIDDLKKLKAPTKAQTLQLEGLNQAQAAFTARLAASHPWIVGTAKRLSFLSGAFRMLGTAIKGVMALFNWAFAAIAMLQMVLSAFDIDIFTDIKNMFVDSSSAAKNYEEGLKSIATQELVNAGIHDKYRQSMGMTKESFAEATKAARDYMIQFAKAPDIGFWDAIWYWDTTTKETTMASLKEAMEELQDLAIRTKEQQVQLRSLREAYSSLKEMKGWSAGIVGGFRELGMSQKNAVNAAKNFEKSTRESGTVDFVYKHADKVVKQYVGKLVDGNLKIESSFIPVISGYGNLVDVQNEYNDAVQSGNLTAEKAAKFLTALKNNQTSLTKAVVKYNSLQTTFGQLKTTKTLTIAAQAYLKVMENEIRLLKVLERTGKQVRDVFASSIKAADTFLAKGQLSMEGEIAATPEQVKTNQLNFLKKTARLNDQEIAYKNTIRVAEDKINLAKFEGRTKDVLAFKQQLTDYKKLVGNASLLQRRTEESATATKAIAAGYIKAAMEAKKLLVIQEKYLLKLTQSLAKLQAAEKVGVAKDRLTILKAEQNATQEIESARTKTYNAQIKARQQALKLGMEELNINKRQLESAEEQLDLQRKLGEAKVKYFAAEADARGAARLRGAEGRAAALELRGPMATDEDRRKVALEIEQIKFNNAMRILEREKLHALLMKERALRDIRERKKLLDLEQQILEQKDKQQMLNTSKQLELAYREHENAKTAFADRTAQIVEEKKIAELEEQRADLNAFQAHAQRDFEIDQQAKKVKALVEQSKINDNLLKGMKGFLLGFGEQVALLGKYEGFSPDITAEGEAKAAVAATKIRTGFEVDVKALEAGLETARGLNNSILGQALHTSMRVHTTRLKLLQIEEKKNKEVLAEAEKTYESNLEAIMNEYETNQKTNEAAKAIQRSKLKGLESERKIAEFNYKTAMTENKQKRAAAAETLRLAMERAAAERDMWLQLGKDITQILKDTVGEGIQALFKSMRDGTLTMENFKQGAKDLLVGAVEDINVAIIERAIVKPYQDLIAKGMSKLFPTPDEIEEKLKGVAQKGVYAKSGAGAEAELYEAAGVQQVFVVNWPGQKIGGGLGAAKDPIASPETDWTSGWGAEGVKPNVPFGSTDAAANAAGGVGSVAAIDAAGGTGQKMEGMFTGIIEGAKTMAQDTADAIGITTDQLGTVGATAVATFSGMMAATGDWKKSMLATFLTMFLQIAQMKLIAMMSAGGGSIRFGAGAFQQYAGGGAVKRDRVPALLEPGEFVIRKPVARAIGGPALHAMNASGKAPTGDVQINVTNNGTPQTVMDSKIEMSPKGAVIGIVLQDMKNNGPIRQAMRGKR